MHGTARRTPKGLTPKTIESLVKAAQPGMWVHERGLCLAIAKSGNAFWAFRYSTRSGKRRLMKLADYEPIDAARLKALEWQAAELRKAVKAGRDPLVEKHTAENKAAVSTKRPTDTFEEVARDYIAKHKDGWKNRKHQQQWENTLATYAYPIIGELMPPEITTNNVLTILQQQHIRSGKSGTLWMNARETASRVRNRIEIVIAAAKAKALSNPETREQWNNHHNPARWEDNLEHWLNGKQSRGHFDAMDWNDAPTLMKELADKSDYSAKALRLTIICAVRTNEAIYATWPEFDLTNRIWIIPAERMKAGVEHRVPLSNAAIDLLSNVLRIEGNPYVFPGMKRNKPLSNMAMLEMLRGMRDGCTVHGFRSTFRDWASETTLHPDAIVEMALAHTIKNKTERAYRRSDLFERRKLLMQQWDDFLSDDAQSYRTKWDRMIAV
jgi:integrase